MHVFVDGYVERQLTKQECEVAIVSLVKYIGMTPTGDYAHRDTAIGPSGYQMLMESHVAFDYIDNYICINIFSCKDFDAMEACRFCEKNFLFTETKVFMVIPRGFGG